MLAMIGLPGGTEWVIILIVALLLFGKRLPEVMRSLGQGIHQFKKGLREVEDEIESAGPGEGTRDLPKGKSDSQSSSPAG